MDIVLNRGCLKYPNVQVYLPPPPMRQINVYVLHRRPQIPIHNHHPSWPIACALHKFCIFDQIGSATVPGVSTNFSRILSSNIFAHFCPPTPYVFVNQLDWSDGQVLVAMGWWWSFFTTMEWRWFLNNFNNHHQWFKVGINISSSVFSMIFQFVN